MSKPLNETRRNFANCPVIGLMVFSKVQNLFKRKLQDTAKQKPMELEMYLFRPIFSLQSQVIEKSISMPLKPTTPNFKKRASKAVFMMFV